MSVNSEISRKESTISIFKNSELQKSCYKLIIVLLCLEGSEFEIELLIFDQLALIKLLKQIEQEHSILCLLLLPIQASNQST